MLGTTANIQGFWEIADTSLSSKRSKTFQLTLGPFIASCNNLFFSSSLIDSYRLSNKFCAVGLLKNCQSKYFVSARPVLSFQNWTTTSIWHIWRPALKLLSKETVQNGEDFTSQTKTLLNSGAIPYKIVHLLFVLPNENFAAISLSKKILWKIYERSLTFMRRNHSQTP